MLGPVQEKLKKARRDLLDLGLRNTLLNYRELKSKGVRIVDKWPEEVFRILVDNGQSMLFLPVAVDRPSGSTEKTSEDISNFLDRFFEDIFLREDEGAISEKKTDTKLPTPYEGAHLQRRLLNTYYAARVALEEQGVNILFLALGFLNWIEDESSDLVHRAPLILIPVSLSRRSVNAQFKLDYTGDEIDTNLSLQMKLKADFGVELPPLADTDGTFAVKDYFELVADVVEHIPRWRVDREAIALGFFSFNKLMMYKDLDEASWPEGDRPSDHELLRSVLHEGFRECEPLFNDNDRLDERIKSGDLHQVCDADSSQTMALLEVKTGRNLVIQGPPGTGKSQTITNLVAEAIAEGKTLLFVSEKMAALEVVKRRLDDVGLGDAAIELHSHKTNKKAFLTELERTLNLGRPRYENRVQNFEELTRNRNSLNRYSTAVHAPIGDSDVTPYQAYGVLLLLNERLNGIELPSIENIDLHEWSSSEYEERRSLIEEVQGLLVRTGPILAHPFLGSRKKVFTHTDQSIIEEKSLTTRKRLNAMCKVVEPLAAEFEVEPPQNLAGIRALMNAVRFVTDSPSLAGIAVDPSAWYLEKRTLENSISTGRRIREIHDLLDSRLLPDAWNADVFQVRKELFNYAQKWWRFMSGRYRKARRDILSLFHKEPPRSVADLLDVSAAILESQRRQLLLEKSSERLAELFGPFWNGWKSDWDKIESITTYLATIHKEVAERTLPGEILDYLKRTEANEVLRGALDELEGLLDEYLQAVEETVKAVAIDEAVRFGEEGVSGLSFENQCLLFRTWEERAAHLYDMVLWNHRAELMRQKGLGPIVKIAATWELAPTHLVELMDYFRHTQIIEEGLRERPELATFDGHIQTNFVKKFRELDKRMLGLNRACLAQKHWEGLQGLSGAGQVGILRHEFEKRRRHRPIRQLMLDAGNAIQAIKPVFMMSPLSVAAYVPPGSVRFDLVVFDEASQVRPIDAFGAILRGGQAVVVGDDRQLPPTSFFDKIGLIEEEEETNWDAGASDMESILGLFRAQGARNAILRWHYRSRHESLIAVSNHKFYDDKLVVFPSPDGTRKNVGLVFQHLADTAYERGKGVNRGEARIVAQAVMKHARERSGLTLGVAAFSLTQMQAIQDELELLRSQDRSCEYYFADHPEEPFFVKNLENVQGDERDVMFISVGYGRTGEGYISMNFGPLNQAGGERRLNVLITRARRRCVVFSNLRADDIDLNRANAQGVIALKTFLKYAETGVLDVPRPSQREADSPFEEAVGRALVSLGLEVHYQVGSGGFFIDLAIVDPERDGRYLLGIECDGATYHRARWARDRDRLRQEILESLGWMIHRIWSTDWFHDPERELRRVIESIERAKARPELNDSMGPVPSEIDGQFENGGAGKNGIERDLPRPDEGCIHIPAYRKASLAIALEGLDLHEVPSVKLAGWIEKVVSVESPVHLLEVASRIASAVNVNRVGSRIRAAIERGARLATKKDRLLKRGDFLWSPQMETAPVRDRRDMPNLSRQIDYVSPEEIAEALLLVADRSVGITPDEAVVEAPRLLGYSRVTENISGTFKHAMKELLADKRLLLQNGFLLLPKEGDAH